MGGHTVRMPPARPHGLSLACNRMHPKRYAHAELSSYATCMNPLARFAQATKLPVKCNIALCWQQGSALAITS